MGSLDSASSIGSNGYTCANCGQWVSYGSNIAHTCQFRIPTQISPPVTWDSTPLIAAALARIATALERLASVAERDKEPPCSA